MSWKSLSCLIRCNLNLLDLSSLLRIRKAFRQEQFFTFLALKLGCLKYTYKAVTVQLFHNPYASKLPQKCKDEHLCVLAADQLSKLHECSGVKILIQLLFFVIYLPAQVQIHDTFNLKCLPFFLDPKTTKDRNCTQI